MQRVMYLARHHALAFRGAARKFSEFYGTIGLNNQRLKMAQTYRIRTSKGDQHFEAEGDKRFVLEMLKRFESGGISPTVTRERAAPGPAALASSKQVSVGEFIRQLGVRKHTDLVVAFGYYLEEHSGLKDFTPADINNCYYEAKMETTNVSQSIIQNIKRGYVMEAKGDKKTKKGRRYTVTATGQAFVRNIAAEAEEDKKR
jgi:hypothetical protein